MSEVSNSDLLKVLMDIKQDIGQLQSTAASTASTLKEHAQQDVEWFSATHKRLQSLELTRATAAGKASVWTLLAGSVGGALGLAGSYVGKKLGLF